MATQTDDLDALVWACAEDGMPFSAIATHVREEFPLSVSEAIRETGQALGRIGTQKAKDALLVWVIDHPDTAHRLGLIENLRSAR